MRMPATGRPHAHAHAQAELELNTWAGMGMLRGKIAGQQTPIAFCDTCETHTPLPASFRTQRQYLPEPLELSLIIVREPARTLML